MINQAKIKLNAKLASWRRYLLALLSLLVFLLPLAVPTASAQVDYRQPGEPYALVGPVVVTLPAS